ncbi:hypothetical protein PAXINDRAFT_18888 [Paxillus involutus ATCC 200175]|uniref:Uncharacterized protein n=1 Tax=Paxillus involutus ATCC 200175 TaxID=664439 RepID=A0A0C9SNH7_PAXIN|nr:hypothetical protein PAXINDRAFT_18888 [Paxillus involutus ATCC 200175]
MQSKEDIERIPNDVEVAWSWVPDPSMEDDEYEAKLRHLEYVVVRSKQIHTCAHRRCLVPDKSGHYYCKRNALFELSPEDIVETDGRWHSKRLYGYLNGWMPALSVNIRCNNDAKLLTNGGDTRNVSFYVTGYQTKKQGKNYNVSAVMAKGYANHVEQMKNADYLQGLRDQQRLLLFRIVHAINCEQELSAPMVISYLMGWGDTFRSHHYTPVYWTTFIQALLTNFPSLRAHYVVGRNTATRDREGNESEYTREHKNSACEDSSVTSRDHEGNEFDNRREHENSESVSESEQDSSVTLDLDGSGKLYAKSQVTDYSERGDMISNMNIVDFFSNTYETTKPNTVDNQASHCGRPQHQRVPYRSTHPCYKTKQRVIRPQGHNNLLNFIGRYFPRNDDSDQKDFYAASMLMLFKPWRNLHTDLKDLGHTWTEAIEHYRARMTSKQKNMVDNIQYFYECERSAQLHRQQNAMDNSNDRIDEEGEEGEERCWELSDDVPDDVVPLSPPVSREEIHGMLAVEAAKRAKIFPNECDVPPPRTDDDLARRATHDDTL